MSTATLLCDETGNFGDAATTVDPVNLIGGIVVPRVGQRALESRWEGVLAALCAEHGVPPHASAITDAAVRAAFVAASATAVREANGVWLFLRAPRAQPDDAPLALYLRTLETWVDLAARLAWSLGADTVDVLPAQRTVPFSRGHALQAIDDQAGQETGASEERTKVRAMVRPGVRVAVEQITQEGGPKLGEVRVDPAATRHAHPGIDLCDFGCSAVRHALKHQLPRLESWPASDEERLFVIAFEDASDLRAVARAAREPRLDLVRLSVLDARLTARRRGAGKREVLVRRGAEQLSAQLRAAAIESCASPGTPDARVKAVVATVAGTAAAMLDARQGEYEGVWAALRDAWAGDGPFAVRARSLIDDAEQGARLERLVLECANHRGDVDAAGAAWDRFVARTSAYTSLALLTESLIATNVRHVALQNRLPAAIEEVARLRLDLEAAASALVATARLAEQVVGLAEELRASPLADASDRRLTAQEAALWTAVGRPRPVQPSSREVGRCFGSAARTWAFLGDHAKALDLALEARARFGEAALDLQFNANVLVRLLCDQARVGSAARVELIAAALALAAPYDMRDPERLVREVLPDAPGARFAIDALLRCLLWAPRAVEDEVSTTWSAYLRRGEQCLLLRHIAGGLRSHPSELVARHAGELVTGDARRAWLDLSLQLSEQAEAGGTLSRFAPFTRALRQGAGHPGAPACSELNPTFEYR